jgi:hypothetical protein
LISSQVKENIPIDRSKGEYTSKKKKKNTPENAIPILFLVAKIEEKKIEMIPAIYS